MNVSHANALPRPATSPAYPLYLGQTSVEWDSCSRLVAEHPRAR
jgi:hypothetical protein